MEYELEEEPRANELVGHRYSDRFIPPLPKTAQPELVRPDIVDRAIRIPEQETVS